MIQAADVGVGILGKVSFIEIAVSYIIMFVSSLLCAAFMDTCAYC